jgi:acetylornithine deacetylase/succinyl-diaminopimelate desuccinylase-like protein
LFAALDRVTGEMWPRLQIIPDMATGASDGIYTGAAGMPTYGVSAEMIDRDDIRAHGKDERVPQASFYRAVDFYDRFLKKLTSGAQ